MQACVADIVGRIEQLDALITLHRQHPEPAVLTIESYQRLREQYVKQLAEVLEDAGMAGRTQ